MKTIKLLNGEIRNGYSFKELDNEAQEKAINKHIQFIIEFVMNEKSIYYDCFLRMKQLKTPWFLAECLFEHHQAEIEKEVENYIYDNEGNILPLLYHLKKGKVKKITFGKKEIECTIEDASTALNNYLNKIDVSQI